MSDDQVTTICEAIVFCVILLCLTYCSVHK